MDFVDAKRLVEMNNRARAQRVGLLPTFANRYQQELRYSYDPVNESISAFSAHRAG